MLRGLLTVLLVLFYMGSPLLAQGQLLIVGGGSEGSWSNVPYQWAVNQSENKRVAIIGFSSATNWLPDYFVSLGAADAKNFQVSSFAEANMQSLYDSLITYDVIFFRGGNQWNYYNHYKNSLLYDAVVDIYNNGGTIAGTSAGLAILSGVVFTAQNGSVLSSENLENLNNLYNTLAGDFFPFKPGFIFDSHFVERGRLARMLGFMLKWMHDHGNVPTGIGVDDQTALTIDTNGLATAYGTGTVTILKPDNLSSLEVNNMNQGQVSRLPLVQLSHGWSYNLNSGEVFPATAASITVTESPLMQGPMQIWLTGSNSASGNALFIADFADVLSSQDELLIISSSPGTAIPISNAFTQAGIQVAGLLNLQDLEQASEIHPAVTDVKAYFFHGQAISELSDFLQNSINGQAMVSFMQTGQRHAVFAGDMAATAGHTMVLNYRTTNASYYGELEFAQGAGLIPFMCIQPNVYESSSYVENTVSGLFEAMITGGTPHGLWLNAGQYARFSVSSSSDDYVSMYVKGDYPVQYLRWDEAYTQRVPFFGGYDRNLFGISAMKYYWINDTSLIVGNAEPVTSTYVPEVLPALHIYPNPVSSYLHVTGISGQSTPGLIIITDISGKVVHAALANGTATIDVQSLNPGTYYVTWNGKAQKFIKH